jgi:hypothetical protein
MKLIKDLWAHLKEWIVVLFVIYKMTSGGA